jgi:hypothetical protein
MCNVITNNTKNYKNNTQFYSIICGSLLNETKFSPFVKSFYRFRFIFNTLKNKINQI